jgi:hypothetical protein
MKFKELVGRAIWPARANAGFGDVADSKQHDGTGNHGSGLQPAFRFVCFHMGNLPPRLSGELVG